MPGNGSEEGLKTARMAPMEAELGELSGMGANSTCRRFRLGQSVH